MTPAWQLPPTMPDEVESPNAGAAPAAPVLQRPDEATLKTRLRQERVSCRLDKDDLRTLCDKLQERANAAADLEWTHLRDTFEESERTEREKKIREGFKLRVTVVGTNGEELFGTIDDVFDSPNLPEEVASFFVQSSLLLRAVYNHWPQNSFEVLLDFRRPKVFDFTLLPSSETPNNSNFVAEGFEASWANGLFHELTNFFARRAANHWLHQHTIYDVLLWVLGFPLGFFVCYRVASPLLQASSSPFVSAAVYVYVFLATLVGFRVLFHYARWVFPTVEFRHKASRALAHRTVLGALTVGLVGALIYDLGRLLR